MTYRQLHKVINALSEEELLGFLNSERNGQRRFAVLHRLHQRYSMLRMQRERLEILREARIQ
jgi:hypothetical protein